MGFLFSSAAFAEPSDGVYVSAFGGGGFLQSASFADEAVSGGAIDISLDYRTSPYLGGAIGYAASNWFFSVFRSCLEL